MKPHVHAELIKAWADGAEIQHFAPMVGCWVESKPPTWADDALYRIKPEEKKPVVRWLWAMRVIQAPNIFKTHEEFLSDEEASYKYGNSLIKLEWSRTEFPE